MESIHHHLHHHHHHHHHPSHSNVRGGASSPASTPSSPSHDFTFSISLHPALLPDKANNTPHPSSSSIDLSPADDIFFHGQLLPLHPLSQLPVSPRLSTNSLESFTLPVGELVVDDHQLSSAVCNAENCAQERSKNKSFSLFRSNRRRKVCEVTEREDKAKQNKRRIRFDVNHVLKKYLRMIRGLPFFREKKDSSSNQGFRRGAYSFSNPRNKQDNDRGGRGQFSAPASMRTSPANSGRLVGTAALPSPTRDSSMEELQAAIQAAIAHCKNSIAKEDKMEIQ